VECGNLDVENALLRTVGELKASSIPTTNKHYFEQSFSAFAE
jgi:hypothetical protein